LVCDALHWDGYFGLSKEAEGIEILSMAFSERLMYNLLGRDGYHNGARHTLAQEYMLFHTSIRL